MLKTTKIFAILLLLLALAPKGARAQEPATRNETDSTATRQDRVLFALKTNLLYDATTMLNTEIEIPIGNRISVLWEDVYPWWNIGYKYCLQHWEMGPELRFWFRGPNPQPNEKLSGWFVGAYGMSAKYDFQYESRFSYQGEYWSAGLTFGWSKILRTRERNVRNERSERKDGRKKNFRARPCRLEFSLGAGFVRTDYRHYLPTDDFTQLIRDKYNAGTVTYYGPTKLKISLVVPIWDKIDRK